MNIISKYIESKKTLDALTNAFPKELENDLKFVFNAFVKRTRYSWTTRFHSNGGEKIYDLSNDETVIVPYRLYFEDTLTEEQEQKLTTTQKDIYHCIFTLCYDGHIREKHIIALLENDNIAEWVYPFILKNSSEYVVEILTTIYNKLKDKDNTLLKEFCKNNLQVFLYCHARMISYWDYFYRKDCYRYENYIGKKLFEECFGYSKRMEKCRKKKETFLPKHKLQNKLLINAKFWLTSR